MKNSRYICVALISVCIVLSAHALSDQEKEVLKNQLALRPANGQQAIDRIMQLAPDEVKSDEWRTSIRNLVIVRHLYLYANQFVQGDQKDEAQRLIQYFDAYGSKVNETGRSLLHWAAYEGNVELARLLIEGGAAVDHKDDAGYTPLFVACENADKDRVDIIKLLFEHDAKSSIGVERQGPPLVLLEKQREKDNSPPVERAYGLLRDRIFNPPVSVY